MEDAIAEMDPLNLSASNSRKKKKKRDSRALSTYFRNSYRTHMSLSSLADRKSHIMIRLNTLLISILLVSFNFFPELNLAAKVSGAIFIATSLGSLVLATLSASPHITRLQELPSHAIKMGKNLFFFGNFSHLSLEEYEDAFDVMRKDDNLIYSNMSQDLYFLGKVLDKKFRFISGSYKIFIIGIIVSVLAFLVILGIEKLEAM